MQVLSPVAFHLGRATFLSNSREGLDVFNGIIFGSNNSVELITENDGILRL